jgi:hypothetical protein
MCLEYARITALSTTQHPFFRTSETLFNLKRIVNSMGKMCKMELCVKVAAPDNEPSTRFHYGPLILDGTNDHQILPLMSRFLERGNVPIIRAGMWLFQKWIVMEMHCRKLRDNILESRGD